MGGKLLVTLIVVGLIWVFWKRKNPAQTAATGRLFRALGAAKAAMQHSAQQRTGTEQPTPRPRAAANPREPIELVRCPKCGGYAPAGQRCTCS